MSYSTQPLTSSHNHAPTQPPHLNAAALLLSQSQKRQRNGGSSGKRRKEQTMESGRGNVIPMADRTRGEQEEDEEPDGENDQQQTQILSQSQPAVRTNTRSRSAVIDRDNNNRSRSKRLSQGASTSQVSSYSGLEDLKSIQMNQQQRPVLGDITNQMSNPSLTNNVTSNRTTRKSSATNDDTKLPSSTTLSSSQRRKYSTTQSISNILNLPEIPSALDESFDSVNSSMDESMTSSSQPYSQEGKPSELTIEEEDFVPAELNTSTSSVQSFRNGLNELRIHAHDPENSSFQLNSTTHSIESTSTNATNQSFASAFSAATSHSLNASLHASSHSPMVEDYPSHAQPASSSSSSQIRYPSSTPELNTTAASTLTVSMAQSLQLSHNNPSSVTATSASSTTTHSSHIHSHAQVVPVPTLTMVPTGHGNLWTLQVLAAGQQIPRRPISPDVPLQEYADSTLTNLYANEAKYLPSPTYMQEVQHDLSSVMRSILIDWLVEVSEEYSLCSQTLFLCVNYVDRFLSVYPVDRAKLQLLGLSALLLASKYWEVRAPTIDEFIYISDSTYSRDQVLRMEGALLNTLQFALTVVTPWDCCKRICHKMGRSLLPERTEFLAEMMMELFMLEVQYLQYRPSVIAASSLFLALYTTMSNNPWPIELETASCLTVESIQLCVRAMHAAYLRMVSNPNGFVPGVGIPPLISIHNKFSQDRFARVAQIPPRFL